MFKFSTMISIEVAELIPRILSINEESNQVIHNNLALIEEDKEIAKIKEKAIKLLIAIQPTCLT